MKSVLLDAGPQIALFSSDDNHHERFDSLVRDAAADGLRLLTTWPCVVEATHLLPPPLRFELLRWISLGGAVIYPFDPRHLDDMLRWMQQYTEPSKREMDFADSTLYWLAVETGITDIMTTDVRDFSRYALPDGRRFNLL